VLGLTGSGGWVALGEGREATETRPAKQHVVHALKASPAPDCDQVKLFIRKPAMRWGTSVWEFSVYGSC